MLRIPPAPRIALFVLFYICATIVCDVKRRCHLAATTTTSYFMVRAESSTSATYETVKDDASMYLSKQEKETIDSLSEDFDTILRTVNDESRSIFMQQELQRIIHHIVTSATTTSPTEATATIVPSFRLVVHPNGKSACTSSIPLTNAEVLHSSIEVTTNASTLVSDKYQMEATLTEYIATRWGNGGRNDDDSECWKSPRTEVTTSIDTTTGHTKIDNTFYNFCDMGMNYTVLQKDYDQLVRVGHGSSLPCRFYTREGVRIVSMQHLQAILEGQYKDSTTASANGDCSSNSVDLDIDGTTSTTSKDSSDNPPMTDCATTEPTTIWELHIYAVPAGRVFMFAPSYIGEIFTMSHMVLPKPPNSGNNTTTNQVAVDDIERLHVTKNISVISLEVLSVVPPIFDIHHFFSIDESERLITKAVAEQSETYRFHRSTTGTSTSNVYSKRTSENAWDTHGATAQLIKRRCFQLLGFDEYVEEMTDGLQILRYNLTTAYVSHLDYLEDSSFQEAYDYESSKKGGNRFATILLYFTTLNEGDGGETVFPRVYPPGVAEEDRISESDGLQILRDSGDTKNVLKDGSWEEKMTVLCRTRFSVRPKALRAVLFYSQFPNGTLDPLSYHGGCPVLRGTKLAANLWTWSAIRPEYDGGPIRDGADVGYDSDDDSDRSEADEAAHPSSILATFRNSGKDERFRNAELYYDEAGYFGKLGFGDDGIAVNTYSGHVWNIKDQVTKIVLQTFIISDSGEDQVFEI